MQLSIILNDGSRTPMHQRAVPCHTDYNPQARFSSRRATWTVLPTDQMRKPKFLTQLSPIVQPVTTCAKSASY